MSAPCPAHGEDQEAIAAMAEAVQRFAEREVAPHATAWDEAGEFPRALYTQAAELGLLGLGYPEALGGTPASWRLRNAVTVGAVPLRRQRRRDGQPVFPQHRAAARAAPWQPGPAAGGHPPVLRGEKIAALAVTEPGGGSDVARAAHHRAARRRRLCD